LYPTIVQRLFSTFANGWPGRGLLIQRVVVGGALLYRDFGCLSATPVCRLAIHQSVGALAGLLLIAGLWTPVAGVLVAGIEGWIALSAPPTAGIPVVLAVLGLTLAMIGPGAWSVDALLYGRKYIALPEP
jgi:putative oxidoreductase